MATVTVDIVVIAPLELERRAILRHVDSYEEQSAHGVTRAVVENPVGEAYRLVILSATGMGNAASAAEVTRAIDVWNPAYVALVGIAGGVKSSERRLGDVVVAEQIVGYELGVSQEHTTTRRYDVHRPAHDFIVAAREVPASDWMPGVEPPVKSARRPRVHFGIVASGEKLVRSKEFVLTLKSEWSKLAAVEMEGFGAALAAFRAPTLPGMFMIRGLSDWADPAKDDRWQEFAANCAAAFFISVLKRGRLKHQVASVITEGRVPHEVVVQAQRNTPFRGKNKIDLCKRLGPDWEDLADYFDISQPDRARFDKGRECQRIWEWLERRDKLPGLPDGLEYIGREDLLGTLDPHA